MSSRGVLVAPSPRPGVRAIQVGGPWWVVVALVVGAAAFCTRLVPLLRGAGLSGFGTYDEGVHYAAAVGMLHGRWLYAEVLFLQPPGMALFLLPFAAIGELTTEVTGLVTARLAVMLLGALTAVLVARYLRPLGLAPALFGGLVYALFPAVAYVERLLLLEGPQNLLLIISLLLISRSSRPDSRAKLLLLLAGVAMGLSASIKIWTVAASLLIMVWVAVARRSWRPAARMLIGAVGAGVIIALPFLLSAPQAMIEMVVTDQLGRRRITGDSQRWTHLTGLTMWAGQFKVERYLPYAITAMVIAVLIALTVRRTRLAAALLVVDVTVVMLSPSPFLHYASLIGVPLGLTVGGAAARALAVAGGPRRWRLPVIVLSLALLATLLFWAKPFVRIRTGAPFNRAVLAPVAQAVPGCVTTDDPGTLIQLGVLGRNAERGCRYIIDLGGTSYHKPYASPVTRRRNKAWQPYAIEYLRSGDLVMISRFTPREGFSPSTAKVVFGWPVVKGSGRFALRQPR